jgi:hypothetical protein
MDAAEMVVQVGVKASHRSSRPLSVPSWATREQVEDWARRIRTEPVAVLAEADAAVFDIDRPMRGRAGLSVFLRGLDRGRKIDRWSSYISGFRKLKRDHPEVVEALVKDEDQEALIGLLHSYRLHPTSVMWLLLDRLDVAAFLKAYVTLGRQSGIYSFLLASMPPAMLQRAVGLLDDRGRGGLVSAFQSVSSGKKINDPGSHYTLHPIPSVFFPGVNPVLDPVLIRDGLDRNVELLSAMAKVPLPDQPQYLGVYTKMGNDVAATQRYLDVPAWKRPLLDGGPEAQMVWKRLCVLVGNIQGPQFEGRPKALAFHVREVANVCLDGATHIVISSWAEELHAHPERWKEMQPVYGRPPWAKSA